MTPKYAAHAKSGSFLPKLLAILACVVVLVIGAFQLYRLRLEREERQLFFQMEPYFTPEALAAYEALPIRSRLGVARHSLPGLQRLEATPWTVAITGVLGPRGDRPGGLVYALEVGDSSLSGCTLSPAGEPGSCSELDHATPWISAAGEPVRNQLRAPFSLHLGAATPFAESWPGTRLGIDASSEVQVEGTIRVDAEGVLVQSPKVLVPRPFNPEEFDRVSVAPFSPETVLGLRAVEQYTYEMSRPMPALLSPFFGGAPRLDVIYAEAALAVDLSRGSPHYRIEGALRILNQNMGWGVVEYVPGQYASAAVLDLSIPTPLSQVCIQLNEGFLEVDLQDKRLRLAGSASVDTAASFTCPYSVAGQAMGFFTRTALDTGLDAARGWLGLPEQLASRGHVVLDLDDDIACADLAVNGYSLFHAAYLGNAEMFQMWSPRSFAVDDIRRDRPLGSLWDLGVGAIGGTWSFPQSRPWHCWDGDRGPRMDLQNSILSRWTPQRAALAGSF